MKIQLDKKQLELLASNIEVYRRGFALYNENKVGELSFGEKNNFSVIQAQTIGAHNAYKVSAVFDTAGLLRKFTCDCAAFGVWRGACKHIIALLFFVIERGQAQVISARRERSSAELLNLFEQQAFTEINENIQHTSQANPVILEPTLAYSGGECRLSFRIGKSRMYMLKNIPQFLDAVTNQTTITYGRDFAFNHSISAFDRLSAELLNLVRNEHQPFEKINREYIYYPRHGVTNNPSYLTLSPHGLDKFFSLYAGKTIKAEFAEGKRLHLTDEQLPVMFNISQHNNGVTLEFNSVFLHLFSGESHRYAAYKDKLYQITPAVCNTLSPIKQTLIKLGERRIHFSEKELPRVFAFVLPKLIQYGLALVSADIEHNLSAETYTKKIYLDADKHTIICRAVLVKDSLETDILHSEKLTSPLFMLEVYKYKAALTSFGFAEQSGRYILTGNDNIFDFLHMGLATLRAENEVFVTDAFKSVSVKPKRQTSVGLKLSGGLLEIEIDSDYPPNELVAILESYRTKKRFHRLKNGAFVDLTQPDTTLDAAAELTDGLNLTDKDFADGLAKIPKFRALYANTVIGDYTDLRFTIDDSLKKLANDFENGIAANFPIPESLTNTLREYQKEGYNWLQILSHYGFGGILADEMGLGKTLQAIALILAHKETEQKEKIQSIVIAPTSLIYNWEKEIHKFAPQLKPLVIAGNADKRKELLESSVGYDVLITTYDMLKRDIKNYSETKFKFVIADEAQNIKNPATQNARAVKNLLGDIRFALTGTPIENALSELWSIFDFIMPSYLYNSTKFSKTFEAPIVKNSDQQAAERLRRHIRPFILRRLKSEVLTELPQKIETTLYAEMLPEQKKMYTAYFLKAKGELDDIMSSGTFNTKRIDILSKLTRLRQICCHPAVFAEDYKGGSGKLDLTVNSIEDFIATGHRLLIFSQFTSMLAILRERLTKMNIPYFYLDGATDSKARLDMVDKFNNGENDIFLISLKAGGSGLNLTGADVVLHYDPWWNPAVMDQASDRAHRIGQTKTVQVFNIVAKDSIEEKIIQLQERKKDLVGSVITEGAEFINRMSAEEINELFM